MCVSTYITSKSCSRESVLRSGSSLALFLSMTDSKRGFGMRYTSTVREGKERYKKIKHNCAKYPRPFEFCNFFLLTTDLKIAGFEFIFFFLGINSFV